MKKNRDIEEIVAHVLKSKGEESQITTLVSRYEKGEPLAYILGYVNFYDCHIQVNSDVLIPRLESEILIELLLKRIEKKEKVLLDLCSGSGCLGIAIKKQNPDLEVVLSDISPKCVELAKQNAKANDVDVTILQGDLLSSLENKKIDYLVCNPPYVSESEYLALEKSVKTYEPKLALTGGCDGLDFYRRVEREVKGYLNDKAKVFFEIGSLQGSSLNQIFSDPVWRHKEILKDWSGHDRFFFLEFQRAF